MILKNFLIKNVIAPHGITDLTHSIAKKTQTWAGMFQFD